MHKALLALYKEGVMVTTQDIINKIDEFNSTIATLRVSLEERGQDIKLVLSGLKDIKVRLDGMDQRFDGIDQRLDGMDQRFDGIDQRLDRMDRRFVSLEEKFDKRFEQVDKRFEQMDRRFVSLEEKFDKRFDQVLQILATLTHKAE